MDAEHTASLKETVHPYPEIHENAVSSRLGEFEGSCDDSCPDSPETKEVPAEYCTLGSHSGAAA